jgi:hypothetical protein
MDKLNEKYNVTKENFILLINRLCNKRAIILQLNKEDSDFDIIKKLNKILIEFKLKKLAIGINILDEEIFKMISLNKNNLKEDEIEKLYIYFYFYNAINDLYEIPEIFNDKRLKWQFIKIINEDYNLNKRFTYINGELLLNKK